MDVPFILNNDCDYITDEEYIYCIECYRYEICKTAWIKEQEEKTKEN